MFGILVFIGEKVISFGLPRGDVFNVTNLMAADPIEKIQPKKIKQKRSVRKGYTKAKSKVGTKQAFEIKEKYKAGKRIVDLVNETNLAYSTVGKIIRESEQETISRGEYTKRNRKTHQ